MPSYRRRAATIEELREQVLLAYGPDARIVEAARVTRAGVGRWLARDEVEALVEVPEGAAAAGGVDASRLDRAGIAALLADADRADGGAASDTSERSDASAHAAGRRASVDGPAGRPGPADAPATGVPGDVPSTSGPAFQALLAEVERSLGAGPAPAEEIDEVEVIEPDDREAVDAESPEPVGRARPDEVRAAAPPTGAERTADAGARTAPIEATRPAAGDLVLLVGLGNDARTVAQTISAERGWPRSWVRLTATRSGRPGGGPTTGASVIADRRAAHAARADALRLDREVLLAHRAGLDDPFTEPAALRPDLVWAVVDASRSPHDTAEWVGRLDAAVGIDGLAIIGTAFTRDRETAERLGFPVAWQERPEASA